MSGTPQHVIEVDNKSSANEAGCEPCDPPAAVNVSDTRPHWVNALLLLPLIGLGMLQGAAFHRIGIFLPEAIGGQMVMKVWIVLKLFIAAVGASMLFQGLMRLVPGGAFDTTRLYAKKTNGLVRVVVGSCTLGVGMAFSGCAPSMLPVQVGAGVRNSWATVVGAFVAGITFALIQKFTSFLADPPAAETEDDAPLVVDRVIRTGYSIVALPVGLMMVGVAIGLEFAVPQSNDEARLHSGRLPWYPTIAGAIIGFNQVPVRLIAGHGLGGTRSIMTVIGTVTFGWLSPANRVTAFRHVWQFVFVWVGTMLGSLTSAQLNHDETLTPTGYPIWRCLIGGFCIVFGALISGGCTCGHGISGFSELSVHSIIAACCIFGAGIGTAFALQAAGSDMCCGFQ